MNVGEEAAECNQQESSDYNLHNLKKRKTADRKNYTVSVKCDTYIVFTNLRCN